MFDSRLDAVNEVFRDFPQPFEWSYGTVSVA
jgi:hypothetical protein